MDRNEEKLKILQERLRQIKEKDENVTSSKSNFNNNSENENIHTISSEKSSKKTSKSKSYSLTERNYIVYFFIMVSLFFISKYYFEEILFDKNDAIVNDEIKQEKEIEIPIAKEYYLDKLISNQKGEIAVILNTKSEAEAISARNELISKGFKASYFFSSEYSNTSDESYEILIGPYETGNELNQWLNNIDTKSITRISL